MLLFYMNLKLTFTNFTKLYFKKGYNWAYPGAKLPFFPIANTFGGHICFEMILYHLPVPDRHTARPKEDEECGVPPTPLTYIFL